MAIASLDFSQLVLFEMANAAEPIWQIDVEIE